MFGESRIDVGTKWIISSIYEKKKICEEKLFCIRALIRVARRRGGARIKLQTRQQRKMREEGQGFSSLHTMKEKGLYVEGHSSGQKEESRKSHRSAKVWGVTLGDELEESRQSE